ncbi:MAG TPA: hypothetical protein VIH61_00270 [Waddliaceae bacterium]
MMGLLVILTITAIAIAIIGLTANPKGPFNAICQLGTTLNGTLLGTSLFVLILDLVWIFKSTKNQESSNHSAIQPVASSLHPSKVSEELLPLPIPPAQRTLCDRKCGLTCFINVALQTMAHLPFYRRLFDPLHQLQPTENETEEKFKCRQRVQILGNQLLNQILSDSTQLATGLGDFLEAVEQALPADLPPRSRGAKEHLRVGGSASGLQMDCLGILHPQGQDYNYGWFHRTTSFPEPGKRGVWATHWKSQFPSLERYPSLIITHTNEWLKQRCPFDPPVTFYPPEESVYYSLEVIQWGTKIHTTAFLREGDEFIEMDDLHPLKPYRKIHIKDIPTWLTKNSWEHLYYSLRFIENK